MFSYFIYLLRLLWQKKKILNAAVWYFIPERWQTRKCGVSSCRAGRTDEREKRASVTRHFKYNPLCSLSSVTGLLVGLVVPGSKVTIAPALLELVFG